MTDGTYEIGMNAGLKFFISLTGCVIAIGSLCHILRSCIIYQRKQRQKYRANKYLEDIAQDSILETDQNPGMIAVDVASVDYGYAEKQQELDVTDLENNPEPTGISSRAIARMQEHKRSARNKNVKQPISKQKDLSSIDRASELELTQFHLNNKEDSNLFESN